VKGTTQFTGTGYRGPAIADRGLDQGSWASGNREALGVKRQASSVRR
jgi:hypothetical protein